MHASLNVYVLYKTYDCLNIFYITAHPIYRQLYSYCINMILALCVITFILILLLHWSGNSSNNYNDTPIYDPELQTSRGIEHLTIPKISGSNKYIKHLPKLNQRVIGRAKKVKDIVDHILIYNLSIMITGKPGFGKSTLAIHAGSSLTHEKLDVYMADIDEHFHQPQIHENLIMSFYDVVSGWTKEQTKRTVLILDNCDKLLVTKKKIEDFKKCLKMMSDSVTVSLIITTQIETKNKNFHIVCADEFDRNASLELLHQSYIGRNITARQSNTIADIVEDCPFALEIVVQVIDMYQSRAGIEDPVEYLIQKLNQSKQEQEMGEELESYAFVMKVVYENLDSSARCCGHCISEFPGSFSSNLFPLINEEIGVPCNDSLFKECVSKLVQNSLLDEYTLDGVMRYKMHTLIQRYFHHIIPSHCKDGYRHMFSLYFSKYCALSSIYNRQELEQANKILASDYHHFERLLLYIKAGRSESTHEAAVLVIAHQRGEITSTRDIKLLYEFVCQCEECVKYIRSSIGNEMFGSVIMNISEKIHDFNFIRCELVTDNFCSKSLVQNPPSSNFSSQSTYNYEVLKITCTCFLMYYFHFIGTVSILGTFVFRLLIKYRDIGQVSKADIVTIVFLYFSFVPSILKLYYGSDVEKIWFSISRDLGMNSWFYYFLAQMAYELFITWFAGHMFQQREVLYAVSVQIMNLLMLFTYMSVPVAIFLADMRGMYTISATKWIIGALIVLLCGRCCVFDYVTKRMSNGILLRIFFRLILGMLNIISELSCKLTITFSYQVYNSVLMFGYSTYIVLIGGFTTALLAYLDIGF